MTPEKGFASREAGPRKSPPEKSKEQRVRETQGRPGRPRGQHPAGKHLRYGSPRGEGKEKEAENLLAEIMAERKPLPGGGDRPQDDLHTMNPEAPRTTTQGYITRSQRQREDWKRPDRDSLLHAREPPWGWSAGF